VVAQLIKAMTQKHLPIAGAKVLVMGLTFKENCPDLRNTRVVDIVTELKAYNCEVDVYDPWVSVKEAEQEYNITPISQPPTNHYDAIILAVAHHQFKEMGAQAIRALGAPNTVLYDLKYLLTADESDLRL
jgi:UDP-N-acetyl-D-galactosamine dehydrogenase